MDIKPCKYCKKTFRGFSALCPNCAEQLDQKYVTVRNYLDKNGNANVAIVAEDTGVEEKAILYLIREGRIALKGEAAAVTCMKCGTPILSGRYCDRCKGSLVQDLKSTQNTIAAKPEKPKADAGSDKGRMHVLKEK